MRNYDVAIVGAGTAGLSARREVAKVTDNYVVIDDGPLGTTCARVGCMPSKVLIQVATDFHRRHALAQQGILGSEGLGVDFSGVMAHVRSLRDLFVRSVLADMKGWEDHLVRKRARFVDLHTLDLGDARITANRVVLATGSSPIIPEPWQPFRHLPARHGRVLRTGNAAPAGGGHRAWVIGLELGQALSRLGMEVVGVTLNKAFGGLSDPQVQEHASAVFGGEFQSA